MHSRAIPALRGALAASFALVALSPAAAAAAPVRISSDPYSGAATGQHATEVEPDSFSFGNRIVAGFQVGRFHDGGAANIGWAASTDAGRTWTHGLLPGITTAGGGPHRRATDPAVAYDRRRGVWLMVSLGLGAPPGVRGERVLVHRSATGTSWTDGPVTVAAATGNSDFDKTWIACDGTPTSPHFGNCYAQWDDFGDSLRLKMSTSTDGGKTWGPPKNTADDATGLGGVPVVQPDGDVIVPYASGHEVEMLSFRSTDGGDSWKKATRIAPIRHHRVAGRMRASPLPSADVDANGRVYVAWQDCRFRQNCFANDIVIATSANGTSWSDPVRIPLAKRSSGEEDFVPGLAVRPGTAGSTAHLALAYHYVPSYSCSFEACRVHVGYSESRNGGANWSTPVDLTGGMAPSWFASTKDGYMSGDYISTSFAGGSPHPVYALARCPTRGRLREAIYVSNPPFGKGGPNCAPPKPRTLSDLKIEPFRFEAAAGGPSIASGGRATVSYRASAAGATRFNVGRAVDRNGSRTWVRQAGKFWYHDVAGANRFRFTGRVGGVKLKPGLYRLAVQPRDPGRRGKISYLPFRIVRPGGGAR